LSLSEYCPPEGVDVGETVAGEDAADENVIAEIVIDDDLVDETVVGEDVVDEDVLAEEVTLDVLLWVVRTDAETCNLVEATVCKIED
jgi:hypothetical protein